MLNALSGGALYVAGAMVLAIVGAVTYLASTGAVDGTLAVGIYTSVLTAVGAITGAHVAGQAVTAAATSSQPGVPAPPTPAAPPAESTL
jgi:hypothetical protein